MPATEWIAMKMNWRRGMSCPRCGGILVAELTKAMEQLICEKTIIEGPYCHCDDVDGSMWASLLPEDKSTEKEALADRLASERIGRDR